MKMNLSFCRIQLKIHEAADIIDLFRPYTPHIIGSCILTVDNWCKSRCFRFNCLRFLRFVLGSRISVL